MWKIKLFDQNASDLYFLITTTKNKGNNQMHNKFNIKMSICQAENGFSLDELVKKLSDASVAGWFFEKNTKYKLEKLSINVILIFVTKY